MSANPYLPIIILFAIGFGFAAFSVGIAAITGPARYNRAKQEAYECGIEPSPQALEGGRFPVKYFLTAMLFIIFDIESVFLYPFAVSADRFAAGGLGVFVPKERRDVAGTSWSNGKQEGTLLPIDTFYIAKPGKDTAATMNAALAGGRNLLLTPGFYDLEAPIHVTRPDTVVLGLGMATLVLRRVRISNGVPHDRHPLFLGKEALQG